MNITVQLYGGLKARVGREELTVEVKSDEPTVADVVAAVEQSHAELEGVLGRVARVVEDEIVDDDHRVGADATVALLPPVSGGSSNRHLSDEPLDRDRLVEQTADDRCGALVVFSGDVRHHNEGRDDVVAIDYEAHPTLAAKTLETVEREVLEQFDIHHCRVVHRTGRVQVGESSVLVVCRGPHRDDTFRAARYAIDELKERTPIWKKECYADGTSRYLDGTPLRGAGNSEPPG